MIGNDGQRSPLSAFSHCEPSRAPLEVNHQGQFAATTLSFNLAPGAQIGPTREAIMQAWSRCTSRWTCRPASRATPARCRTRRTRCPG
ncbi:hypothetical protein P4133_36350 [Pseudomonas aeruginosa]|nr:hypothetical protein [Pseudomonas aeruginosa]